MRPSNDLRNLGGALALVGMLLLASPGVRVNADEASARTSTSEASGAVCQAPAETRVSLDATHLVEYYRYQAMQARHTPEAADDVVMLNNRGYNYGPPPSADSTRIAFEASR